MVEGKWLKEVIVGERTLKCGINYVTDAVLKCLTREDS